MRRGLAFGGAIGQHTGQLRSFREEAAIRVLLDFSGQAQGVLRQSLISEMHDTWLQRHNAWLLQRVLQQDARAARFRQNARLQQATLCFAWDRRHVELDA